MSRIDVIQIDTSVPVPSFRGKYPLHELKVGDSFLITEEARASVASAVSRIKRNSSKNFTMRKEKTGGVRVWRTM